MAIVPELLIENSESYIMSIRLAPDGLSFSGYRPNENGSFFYTEEVWNGVSSYVDWVKECFFSADWLSQSFRQLYVVQSQSSFTIVPLAYYSAQEKEHLFNFTCGNQQADKVLSIEWKETNQVLLYTMGQELYDFCSRSLDNPQFICSQWPLLVWWRNEGLNNLFRQMFLHISDGLLTVACFAQGNLLYSNYYAVHSVDDMLYYTLYIWKQLGWNAQSDQLKICGEAKVESHFATMLRTYIRQVDSCNIPSETYLLGDDLLRTPTDLIALSINENN